MCKVILLKFRPCEQKGLKSTEKNNRAITVEEYAAIKMNE